MIFARIRVITLTNLFNSNCELEPSGIWLLPLLIVRGQPWADWMAIGSLESSPGMLGQVQSSYRRQVGASLRLTGATIYYQRTQFSYRMAYSTSKCFVSCTTAVQHPSRTRLRKTVDLS